MLCTLGDKRFVSAGDEPSLDYRSRSRSHASSRPWLSVLLVLCVCFFVCFLPSFFFTPASVGRGTSDGVEIDAPAGVQATRAGKSYLRFCALLSERGTLART